MNLGVLPMLKASHVLMAKWVIGRNWHYWELRS